MRFDDRLKTVLAQPAANPHDRAVRWRQLVELLARGGTDLGSPLVRQALDAIRADAEAIDEQLRAATARAVAGPRLPHQIVAVFAADGMLAAAPVLSAVDLTPEQWGEVLTVSSPEARRFIRALHPDLPEEDRPSAGDVDEAVASAADVPAGTAPIPSISEVLARIERLRQGREPPLGERRAGAVVPSSAAMFRWECDPSGEIAWIDGAPRGALIGRSIAGPAQGEKLDERIRHAFAMRAPFRDAQLRLGGEGAIAGEWKVSGVPAFEPGDGRFAGYRGIARRPERAADDGPASRLLDHDSLRELVHEIKTPLNAIIGFAEIIDGQYLGPADHSYRERAAGIVAQARLLLTAIEDLDLAAKLRATSGSTGLGELVTAALASLAERASDRGVWLDLGTVAEGRCAIEASIAERIVRRFVAALLEAAEEGERLTIEGGVDSDRCVIALDRPKLLHGKSERQLLEPSSSEAGPWSNVATGFSLRLVRGLARLAGGDLLIGATKLTLALPREKANLHGQR